MNRGIGAGDLFRRPYDFAKGCAGEIYLLTQDDACQTRGSLQSLSMLWKAGEKDLCRIA
jgi:hypothetical protein